MERGPGKLDVSGSPSSEASRTWQLTFKPAEFAKLWSKLVCAQLKNKRFVDFCRCRCFALRARRVCSQTRASQANELMPRGQAIWSKLQSLTACSFEFAMRKASNGQPLGRPFFFHVAPLVSGSLGALASPPCTRTLPHCLLKLPHGGPGLPPSFLFLPEKRLRRRQAAHARVARASSTADPTWHTCMPLPMTDCSQDSLMMSDRSQAKGHREASPEFGSIAGTGSPCICRVSAGSNSLRPSILYKKLFLVSVGAHPEGLMST